MADNRINFENIASSSNGEGVPLVGRGKDVDAVLARLRSMVAEEAALGISSTHLALGDRLSEDHDQPFVLHDPLVLTPELRVDEPIEAPVEIQGPTEESSVNNVFAEAPFSDEVALREMVADIVREELQGELGERLTANVRKLVRREIAQALRMNQNQ